MSIVLEGHSRPQGYAFESKYGTTAHVHPTVMLCPWRPICSWSCAWGRPRARCRFRKPIFVSQPRRHVVGLEPSTHSAASEGNDGPWSSFELRVGTPAQNVRFLPGTSSTSTLVVLPEGCRSGQPSNCANARGGIFNISASSTWSNIGIYELGFENNLGYTDAGQFGFDTGGFPSVNRYCSNKRCNKTENQLASDIKAAEAR